jgi:hypothetical protein
VPGAATATSSTQWIIGPACSANDIGEQSVVVDVVERSGQVGIENP